MTMKTVYNLEDYVKYNKKDTFKIFYNILSKNPVYLEDIEDVIQHFYLAAHRLRTVERWEPDNTASFSTWMYGCIKNFIRSYYTGSTHKELFRLSHLPIDFKIDKDSTETYDCLSFVGGTEDYVEEELEVGYIRDVLMRLNKVQRHKNKKLSYYRLFNYYISGYNDSEVAKELGISSCGVGKKKFSLRKVIHKIYDGSLIKYIKLHESLS